MSNGKHLKIVNQNSNKLQFGNFKKIIDELDVIECLKSELSSLDNVLTLCIEDFIDYIGLDINKLPQVMRVQLVKKGNYGRD